MKNWTGIGKDLEGVGPDVSEVFEGTEGNHENPQLWVGVSAEIRQDPVPYTNDTDQMQ